MRTAPLALASTTLVSLAFAFAACSGGSAQPPSSSGAGGPPASGASSAQAAVSASAAAPVDPVLACAATPAVEAKCEGLAVMQNGGAVGDAGPSARLQSICDLVKSHRDSFRCCFDLWGKEHAGVSAKVSMTIEVKQDGSFVGVELDKAKSTLTDPAFERCATAVAKSLTYPESSTGKPTRYTHAFDFKAKP